MAPGYSVADEQPISDAASIREPDNLHAFFLCTDPDDFQILSRPRHTTSCCSRRRRPRMTDRSPAWRPRAGARYVNLEVGLGHNGRQKEMLDWLEWILPEERKSTSNPQPS